MAMQESASLAWRKSSYSDGGSEGASCVEVAPTGAGIALRDSKHGGDAVLSFPTGAWRDFLGNL